jgi:exodeoxyribonuclease VII small subunit
MTSEKPEGEAPFEALLSRLSEIARHLEGDGVPLEKALALFEEGVRLTRAAQGRLDSAEARVEELVGAGRTKPLDVEGTSPKRRG